MAGFVHRGLTAAGKDRALAIALAVLLGALWLHHGWREVARGVLPDSDDMVRMAQVRDWLGGQRFTDLSQHRLGLDGSGALHWSRLGDMGIALWILALRPLLGTASAEIWAAILYPVTLFALALIATGRLARRVGHGADPRIAILSRPSPSRRSPCSFPAGSIITGCRSWRCWCWSRRSSRGAGWSRG